VLAPGSPWSGSSGGTCAKAGGTAVGLGETALLAINLLLECKAENGNQKCSRKSRLPASHAFCSPPEVTST
jgi:hypothetical protein